MYLDFRTKNEYIATEATGEITIKRLSSDDAEAATLLYKNVSINSANYKRFIGLCEYDDFYGFGGKYNPLDLNQIKNLINDKNTIIIGAFSNNPTYHCCGLVWIKKDEDYFSNDDNFRFKPEYAGVRNIFKKHVQNGDIVIGPDTAYIAPDDFPSLAIVLNYAIICCCLDAGFNASAYELYKNISCTDCDGIHYLDTFDYNAYNAYKVMGYDHVGYMTNKVFKLENDISICTEPQIIAGLDFSLQKKIIEKILLQKEVLFK